MLFRSAGTFSVPWLFGTASSESLQLIYAGGSGLYVADGGAMMANLPMTTNTWIHVVATRAGNGGALCMYVNGVLASTAIAGSMLAATTLSVGTSTWYPARAFNGTIDDLRVYSRVLSASEVTTLFTTATATVAASSTFAPCVQPTTAPTLGLAGLTS